MYRIARLMLSALVSAGFVSTALAQSQRWQFVVCGDTRGTSTSDQINTPILTEIAQAITNHNPAFVLVPGDLVNSGTLSAFQAWTNIMAPVYQAGIGIYPVIGNHDTADVNGFKTVFGPTIPDNGPAGEIDRTYFIAYSNALILNLDTYVNVGRVNQSWINAVLATNTRPHVFAQGHMPAFKANHTDCLDDYPADRNIFWNSLSNVNCRIYFAGHDHFYSHTRLDDGDGNINNDVHQMIVGTGGAPIYTSYAYDGDNTPYTPQLVYHEQEYGYMLVEIDGYNVTSTWYHRTGANTYAATSDVFAYTVGPPNDPPSAPTLISPADNVTGLTNSPILSVSVADPDTNSLTVSFYGRATGTPSFGLIGVNAGVASGSGTSKVWPGLLPGTAYDWYVSVSDGQATTTGPTWHFTTGTVQMAPLITTQPADLNAREGTTATFSVGATGLPPLRYQWRKGGATLSGATNSFYTISSVQLADAGSYSVFVSNDYGSTTSSNAILAVIPFVPLAEALNTAGWVWSTAGGAPWFGQTNLAHDGRSSAQSGSIADGQQSRLSTTVSGPGTLRFWWKVSSQTGADTLSFKIGGLPQAAISGEVDWAQRTFYLPVGSQTLEWVYAKDPSASEGFDRGWVDEVTFGTVRIVAWGNNGFGQTTISPAATDTAAIAAGAWHSLALRKDGGIAAWGNDYDGQCDVPPDLTNAVAIAAGGYHSLAARADGTVIAWGANYYGQTDVPAGATDVVSVAAGGWHSLALRSDGRVLAWGDSSWGQTSVPADLTNAVAIAAGGNHSLALRSDGTVVAWGDNYDAQGNYVGQSAAPWGLADVVAVAAGESHSLALKADGTVVAWGDNSQGQSAVPPGLTGAIAIAGGGMHSLALLSGGKVVAWGNDAYGQSTVATNLLNVTAVAGGAYHSLALLGESHAGPQLANASKTKSGFRVALPTVRGKVYFLEFKAALPGTGWTIRAAVVGDGRVRTLTDPNAGGSQGFYRVREQ